MHSNSYIRGTTVFCDVVSVKKLLRSYIDIECPFVILTMSWRSRVMEVAVVLAVTSFLHLVSVLASDLIYARGLTVKKV